MDLFAAYLRGGASFQSSLGDVPIELMSAPTPCAGWTVRDLINHVVGGELRYILLLGGASTAQVEATRGQDHVGSDPAAAFAALHAQLSESFQTDGALDRVVHHRLGDRKGGDLLLMRTMEYALHGWDLGVARSREASIEPPLARLLLDALGTHEQLWQGDSVFAPQQADDASLPASERLLRLTGRA